MIAKENVFDLQSEQKLKRKLIRRDEKLIPCTAHENIRALILFLSLWTMEYFLSP